MKPLRKIMLSTNEIHVKVPQFQHWEANYHDVCVKSDNWQQYETNIVHVQQTSTTMCVLTERMTWVRPLYDTDRTDRRRRLVECQQARETSVCWSAGPSRAVRARQGGLAARRRSLLRRRGRRAGRGPARRKCQRWPATPSPPPGARGRSPVAATLGVRPTQCDQTTTSSMRKRRRDNCSNTTHSLNGTFTELSKHNIVTPVGPW